MSVGFSPYSKALSDVQILSQRITQLESALVQAEPRHESTRRDLAIPEEPKISASSKVNSPGISTSPSGRERVILSESSPSSSIFAPTATNTCNSAPANYDSGINVSANPLGPNWFFNGMPIFSEAGRQWVSTRTDQDVTWAEFCIPMHSSSVSTLPPSFSQAECNLPEQDAAREIMSAFFQSSFRLTFPVLDQVLFETTMETAYEPVDRTLTSSTQAAAMACVLGALSIATRLNAPQQSTASIDAEVCSVNANSLLMHLTGDISLETLQAMLLMVSPDSNVARTSPF